MTTGNDQSSAPSASRCCDASEYAAVALTAMAGIVCTPEKGYVADGGPQQMGRDIKTMIGLFKNEIALRQEAFEIERDKNVEDNRRTGLSLCARSANAISIAAQHLEEVVTALAKADDPRLSSTIQEVEDALHRAGEATSAVMRNFVNPVYGTLPENVRESIRKAEN